MGCFCFTMFGAWARMTWTWAQLGLLNRACNHALSTWLGFPHSMVELLTHPIRQEIYGLLWLGLGSQIASFPPYSVVKEVISLPRFKGRGHRTNLTSQWEKDQIMWSHVLKLPPNLPSLGSCEERDNNLEHSRDSINCILYPFSFFSPFRIICTHSLREEHDQCCQSN